MDAPECSLIVPVYRNAESIARLVERIAQLDRAIPGGLEAVFVVDGSPDESYRLLRERLPSGGFRSRLLQLSRNFGAFSAIRAGLANASGPYFAVMAADLQEPASLIEQIFVTLRDGSVDVALAVRKGRADPLASKLSSALFWWLFRRLVQKEVPEGGIDVFGCHASVRDVILALPEANSSLVSQVLWAGFRKRLVPYCREAREEGSSSWSFRKRMRYLSDSVFSFTDLPITILLGLGVVGVCLSAVLTILVVLARLFGEIDVPGYTPTVLLLLFSMSLNLFAFGIIGSYVWRAFENTKQRPLFIKMSSEEFEGRGQP